MPHLEVNVGPDRFHMEPCRLNDSRHPHEIDTEHFCGRVLVRILDAPGAKEGEPGREYFNDRSRRFCIQIEGRFKQEWSGDDILFGSDFDKFVPFPRAPFNAGMRVARMIDPCTFYEEHPPSGRPYIMSPYAACMNVFCAWPAPHRLDDAIVVSHDHGDMPSSAAEHQNDGGIVPIERIGHEPRSEVTEKRSSKWLPTILSSHKDDRVTDSYWRFLGFKDDPLVQAYIHAHSPVASTKSPTATTNTEVLHAPTPTPSLMRPSPVVACPRPRKLQQGINTSTMIALGSSNKPHMTLMRGHIDRSDTPDLPVFLSSNLVLSKHDTHGSPGMIQTPVPRPVSTNATVKMLQQMRVTPSPASSLGSVLSLDDKLGPWRFKDPGADMIEDNAFIFKTESVPVSKRRKYFADEANRKNFKYHPDVVYGTSFFSNLFDFNTFDLSIGPVHINVHPFFREMPIRYTLRSRTDENIVFCTVSFQLVD